jgi:hypothetical protein
MKPQPEQGNRYKTAEQYNLNWRLVLNSQEKTARTGEQEMTVKNRTIGIGYLGKDQELWIAMTGLPRQDIWN